MRLERWYLWDFVLSRTYIPSKEQKPDSYLLLFIIRNPERGNLDTCVSLPNILLYPAAPSYFHIPTHTFSPTETTPTSSCLCSIRGLGKINYVSKWVLFKYIIFIGYAITSFGIRCSSTYTKYGILIAQVAASIWYIISYYYYYYYWVI